MRHSRPAPGRRLLAVFVLTIFVPGLLLAFFGGRSLWQERDTAHQRLAERVALAAERARRALAGRLSPLAAHVEQKDWTRDVRLGPPDGSWAFVVRETSGVRVYPSKMLPFVLNAEEPLTSDAPPSPAEMSYREARALDAAGRTTDAVRIWRQLERDGGTIGSMPADLVAGAALAERLEPDAQRLYDRLASGQWPIDKGQYKFYSAKIIGRVQIRPEEAAAVRLGDALEAALSGSDVIPGDSGVFVAFRRVNPPAALVLSAGFLSPIVPSPDDPEVVVSHITANGTTVFGGAATSERALSDAREVRVGGIAWMVEVAPKDAAAFVSASARRSTLYLGMLGSVLALLAVGGVLVVRTVRREMEVARLKSDFVSTVSHEFRSPLTGIRQLAELLSRDRVPDDTKRHQYYDMILNETERLGRLVESVLDFARMEDARKQYRFAPLETSVWLGGVAREFERDASRAGFALDASIPDNLPRLTADPEALTTAVRNLLDNAMKYSPSSSTVWLEADAFRGQVRIRVRDQGVGIPRQQQGQIFEKFYRVQGDLADRVKGVGLGLSLVRHIVDAHRGTITVESHEGKGSTFQIELAGAS